ncbi:hypothetical protein BH10ACT6_BH10ACT6_01510 [soil metagenome]
MAHRVDLGSQSFHSKKTAKAYISVEILHKYDIGTPIDNPEHKAVLYDVLRRKENAAEKIGSGIDYFYVDYTSKFREEYVKPDARTIVIHHTSSAEPDVDFGYGRVIDGSSDVDYSKEALRYAVAQRRDDFKFGHFLNGRKPLDSDGNPIDSHEDSEVRYRDPDWGTLTADFAESQGGWEAIETHSGDGVEGQIGRRLINGEVEKRWLDYYDSHANPVLVRKPGT